MGGKRVIERLSRYGIRRKGRMSAEKYIDLRGRCLSGYFWEGFQGGGSWDRDGKMRSVRRSSTSSLLNRSGR